MVSLRSGALKRERLGLSCKANKCSDAGTGDLGVLPTHETSLMKVLNWFTEHWSCSLFYDIYSQYEQLITMYLGVTP